MADSFVLPPTSALPVAVNFTADERPYVQAWYQDTKQPADTPDTFIRRILLRAALHHREGIIRQQVHDEVRSTARTMITTETAALDTDIATVQGTFGV